MEAEPLNARNESEIIKLQDIMELLGNCIRYREDPTPHLADLTETINDLVGQVDLYEISQDNDRLITAQSVLNSVYKCKCDFLELAYNKERAKHSSLWK